MVGTRKSAWKLSFKNARCEDSPLGCTEKRIMQTQSFNPSFTAHTFTKTEVLGDAETDVGSLTGAVMGSWSIGR